MERLALRTAAVGPRGGNRSDTGTFGVKDLRRSGSKRRRKADRAPGSEDGVLVKLCVEQTVHLRADADLAAVAREAGDLPAPVPRFAEIMPKKIQAPEHHDLQTVGAGGHTVAPALRWLVSRRD